MWGINILKLNCAVENDDWDIFINVSCNNNFDHVNYCSLLNSQLLEKDTDVILMFMGNHVAELSNRLSIE